MISLKRTQTVGAHFVSETVARFFGQQEDHIYGMEVTLDVDVATGEILEVSAVMKRFTNPLCPRALDVVSQARGMRLKGQGWESRLMKKVGREGCQHLAEIIIECGRSLDLAWLARDLARARTQDPGLDEPGFIAGWLKEHPGAADCLAGPAG